LKNTDQQKLKKNKKNIMHTNNTSFNQLRQQPYILEMLTALEKGLTKYNIDFYLVGTNTATDYVYTPTLNNMSFDRNTANIEFTFFINDKNVYVELREYLIHTEGFSYYKGDGFSLTWKNRIKVDLIPFAEIDVKPSKVTFGLTNLKTGITEIYNFGLAQVVKIKEKHCFKVCSLAGIVILKLIHFQENPKTRLESVKDISQILNHFFDLYAHEIYKKHNDLFDNHDINLQLIAGRVIGRDMRKITELNEELFFMIKNLLKKNTIDTFSSDIAKIMTDLFMNTVEDNLKILEQIKIGHLENPFITEQIPNNQN
jgi:predicted nucleotidyltransferase